MNKNIKVITINGIRGLLMTAFIFFGLISGFIFSPAWVCMKLWNYFVTDYFSVSSINFYQGLLIWGVIALTIYALNRKQRLIKFGSVYHPLTKEQVKEIISKSQFCDFEVLNELKNISKENDENKKTETKEKKEELRG